MLVAQEQIGTLQCLFYSQSNSGLHRYSRIDTTEIQFGSDEKGDEPPIIKAATLAKLIERATYDKYPSKFIMSEMEVTQPQLYRS